MYSCDHNGNFTEGEVPEKFKLNFDLEEQEKIK